MEYIIIGLISISIIISIVALFKNINEANITERLGKMETSINKEVGIFKNDLTKELNEDFSKLNEKMEQKLEMINEKVNIRLDKNFEKTNETFSKVLERISKIDEAQKKIETLSTDIVSLQSVLTDKKSRGIFGEVNLKNILSSVFGENNNRIYQMQYQLKNGKIADAVLFAPEPLNTIAIDSKFPLENYQTMVDKKNGELQRLEAEKKFKADMKKHIDAIGDKYIISGQTSDQAILFLPAEAIFAEVNAYHSELVEYAYKKKVFITSPTTLLSTLTTIQMIIKNMERDKYASIIQTELSKLSVDFDRYKTRWEKLSRSIDAVSKDAENLNITTEKITKKFDSINNVQVKELDE